MTHKSNHTIYKYTMTHKSYQTNYIIHWCMVLVLYSCISDFWKSSFINLFFVHANWKFHQTLSYFINFTHKLLWFGPWNKNHQEYANITIYMHTPYFYKFRTTSVGYLRTIILTCVWTVIKEHIYLTSREVAWQLKTQNCLTVQQRKIYAAG